MKNYGELVDPSGFEPEASRLQSGRSTRLIYGPLTGRISIVSDKRCLFQDIRLVEGLDFKGPTPPLDSHYDQYDDNQCP